MIIKLADSNRYFCTFLILIFINYFNYGITGERIGYLYFNFLCYKNPWHYDVNGQSCDSIPSKNCDPSFKICISPQYVNTISRENCPIHFQETNSYDNAESVCDESYDNRESLKTQIIKEIPYVAKIYFVTISIIDDDSWSSAVTYIATFGAQFTPNPSKDKESPKYEHIKMHRLDQRYSNGNANMKISMALQCDYERYGERCEVFCRPSSSYSCSKEGKKICKEGWKGEKCDKSDLCVYKACNPGAECIEKDNVAKCKCNQHFGPECNPNYDPCSSNPCENNGSCIPNKTGEAGVRCSCSRPFYGSKCENKFDLCEIEPCHNNATCEYDENYKRRCICLPSFAGALCDHKISPPEESFISNRTFNWTQHSFEAYANKSIQTSQSGMVLSILLGIIIFIVAIVAIVTITLFIKRKRRIWHLKNDQKISMNELEIKLIPQRVISNDYFVTPKDECIYETVKEETTYAYLQEQNDDYLIPSRPTTPGFSTIPTNNDESEYLEMSVSLETNRIIPQVVTYEKETDLPPLPTRELKRKLSLSKFCLS